MERVGRFATALAWFYSLQRERLRSYAAVRTLRCLAMVDAPSLLSSAGTNLTDSRFSREWSQYGFDRYL